MQEQKCVCLERLLMRCPAGFNGFINTHMYIEKASTAVKASSQLT